MTRANSVGWITGIHLELAQNQAGFSGVGLSTESAVRTEYMKEVNSISQKVALTIGQNVIKEVVKEINRMGLLLIQGKDLNKILKIVEERSTFRLAMLNLATIPAASGQREQVELVTKTDVGLPVVGSDGGSRK